MGVAVVQGASLMCPFGTAPCLLNVTSQQKVQADNKPVATIQDCTIANIPTFGMCTSMANPSVAAATAAKLGVMTPMPCVPVPAGTWTPMNPKGNVAGKPPLVSGATLICGCGAGMISIVNPGQTKVMM